MRALNVEVPPELVDRWKAWFAPQRQPFLLDAPLAERVGRQGETTGLPPELRDTYEVYGLDDGVGVLWLDEAEFTSLDRSQRTALVAGQRRLGREQVPTVRQWRDGVPQARAQADGHRFVWWPSLLTPVAEQALTGYVEEGRRPSRHDEVTVDTWRRIEPLLPGARGLAGTFAPQSGPNCFGTVMAASGVPGASEVWMQREPFEEWLGERTRPGGSDTEAGTVLVWRSADGLVQHAAVTLGDGWALHKPSQGWFDPVKVLAVEDLKRSARSNGRRLRRHRLRG